MIQNKKKTQWSVAAVLACLIALPAVPRRPQVVVRFSKKKITTRRRRRGGANTHHMNNQTHKFTMKMAFVTLESPFVSFALGIGVDGFARFGRQRGRDRFDKRLLRPDRPHSRSTTFQTPTGRSRPAAPSRLAAIAGLSRQIVKSTTATINFYPQPGFLKKIGI